MATHTYNFARLSLLGAEASDKERFLIEALQAPVHVEDRTFRYGAFDVQLLEYRAERFLYGKLVKYNPQASEEVVDEANQQIVDADLPFGKVADTKFFVHIRTGITAYRPIRNRISEQQFRTFFVALIREGRGQFFADAHIETVDEEVRLDATLSIFSRVSKIITKVWPTNPSNREPYRSLDERLSRLDAQSQNLTLTGGPNGLNKDELRNDIGFQAVLMAVDGYGTATIIGEDSEGVEITVHTDTLQVTVTVEDADEPNALLGRLFAKFEDIWNRTTNG